MTEEERKAKNNEKSAKSRAKKKARMAVDPEYAAEVRAKKAESDRKYYEKADKNKLNAQARERVRIRKLAGPEFNQQKCESAKRYFERHRDEVLAYKKRYREANKEAIAEYMRQWELDNRDKRYAINAKRRMVTEKSPVEPIDRSVVWNRDQGICGICGEDACQDNWHLDHVIPISRGGPHVYENVQVSHPLCNQSKGNKLPQEV